jgi:hypothetical protein
MNCSTRVRFHVNDVRTRPRRDRAAGDSRQVSDTRQITAGDAEVGGQTLSRP